MRAPQGLAHGKYSSFTRHEEKVPMEMLVCDDLFNRLVHSGAHLG